MRAMFTFSLNKILHTLKNITLYKKQQSSKDTILNYLSKDTIHKIYSVTRRHQTSQSNRTVKSIMTNGELAELDSHADTTCCGRGFKLINDTGKTVSVEPFLTQYEPVTDIPIGTCITAYDDEKTGQTYILQFNQALYFGDRLETSLLNPNQMRDNHVIVDDCPMSLSHDNKSTHSIILDEVNIDLQLNNVFSGFNCRTPTPEEIENCSWLVMTSNREWNPYNNKLSEREARLRAEYNQTNKDIRFTYSITTSNPVDDVESNFSHISSIHTYNTRTISTDVSKIGHGL